MGELQNNQPQSREQVAVPQRPPTVNRAATQEKEPPASPQKPEPATQARSALDRLAGDSLLTLPRAVQRSERLLPKPAPSEDTPSALSLPVLSVPVHQGPVNALAVTDSGVFTGGEDGAVVFTELLPRRGGYAVRLERVLEGKKPILAMAVSPDNRAVAVAQTGQVTVFERAGGTVPHVLTIVKGRITALQWDPRGEFLAIGRADGEIVLWRLKGSYRAGENCLEALETYRGATSPVVGIKFHPSSRLFFAAEESGAVTLWRLLRTEEEMGLRDTTAEADLERESDRGRSVGKVPGRASDLWLSPDGALLFVSSGEGRVFSWRVRGLVPLGDFAASQEEVLSLTGLSTGVANQGADGSGMYVVLTSSRGQRLELFCQNSPQPRQSVQPPPSRLSLAQSRILSKPASVVRSGGGVVWGGDREGNLLIVEERSVLSSPPVSQKIKQCSRQ